MHTPSCLRPAALIGILLLAVGCASEKIKVTPLSADADPTQEISKLDKDLTQARINQTDYFAPHYYSESVKRLSAAQKLRSENKPNTEILGKVAEGNAFLAEAEKRADISRLTLKDVREARNQALEAGAAQNYAADLRKTDSKLLDLTQSIEKGDAKISEKDRNSLLDEYRSLGLMATRTRYLGETQNLVATAKKEGAAKWAPKTLSETQTTISELDQLITKDPQDKTAIEKMSRDAEQQANFLLDVTRRSKLIEARNPEETVLQMEKQKEEIATLGKETTEKEQVLSLERERVMTLKEQTAAEDRFQRVRAYFTPEEAEVLRTDGHVVIRLKGLKFPSAKAEIPSENFALLSKVEKALAEFKDNKITVEGHTDSIGSPKTNKTISLKRAESVKNYLVASEAAAPDKIVAEGKGFMEPIASNRTNEGRALNRRVDIVIEQASG